MKDKRMAIIGGSEPWEVLIKGKIKETEDRIKLLREEQRIDLNPRPEKDCSKGHRYQKGKINNHKETWKCKHCEREL